jgi:hypothetical protein
VADEKKEEETYLTKPASQVDHERRLAEDYQPDARVDGELVVNPNPFGAEDYAGTDPIYQNHANDTEAPLAAEEGPDKDAEDFVRDLHDLDDVDDGDKAEDYGLGGEATKAGQSNLERERMLVPGQEGYPENPEKYTGPAVPASAVQGDGDSSDDDKPDEVATGDAAAQSSTPTPAGTQPPKPQGSDTTEK